METPEDALLLAYIQASEDFDDLSQDSHVSWYNYQDGHYVGSVWSDHLDISFDISILSLMAFVYRKRKN